MAICRASAIYWLQEVCTHPDSRLVLIDRFDCNEGAGRERRRKLDDNIAVTGQGHKVSETTPTL
jgi:hypothetical protein